MRAFSSYILFSFINMDARKGLLFAAVLFNVVFYAAKLAVEPLGRKLGEIIRFFVVFIPKSVNFA